MRAESYQLVVASILYSQRDTRVGCRPYELLEHLRLVLGYSDEQHNAIVFHVERLRRFVVELRLSCESRKHFIVVIQQETSDGRKFHAEHNLCSNPPENYILDLGDSKNRLLTIYRVEEDGARSTKSEPPTPRTADSLHADSTVASKIHKSNSFLKRLWRNRCGMLYQISLSSCALNAWNQHSLSSIIPNSVITFRVLRKSDESLRSDGNQTSTELLRDFTELTRRILETDARTPPEREGREYSGDVSDVGDAVLDHTFKFSGFPRLFKRILLLTVLLDWKNAAIRLSSEAIPLAVTQLRICSHSKVPLCADACEELSRAIADHIRSTIRGCAGLSLFPLSRSGSLSSFAKRVEVLTLLCNLEIWLQLEHLSPKSILQAELEILIQRDVQYWLVQCGSDLPHSVSSLLGSTPFFADLPVTTRFFAQFNISYTGIVFAALDAQLSELGQQFVKIRLSELNSHDEESLENFTKATMKLYEGFKNLARFATDVRIEGGQIFLYEEWFTPCAIFWTYTWRSMCRRITLLALREDEATTCEERVLPSAVNFLAVHKAICEDFLHLDLHSTATSLMCTLKIAAILADDLIIYAKRMQAAAATYDGTKALLAANSIEHTRTFVAQRASRILQTSSLLAKLSPAEGPHITSSLRQILSSAAQHCETLSKAIVSKVCRDCTETIAKQCFSFTQFSVKAKKNLGWLRSVLSTERADHLLATLERLSTQISGVLFPRLCDVAHRQLLLITEQCIFDSLLKGQTPAYYRQIEIDCDMVRRVLQMRTSDASAHLSSCLYLNSLTTEQLVLQYYAQLAELTENCPIDSNCPTVTLRVAYVRTTHQQITILIEVVKARNLPVLDMLTNSADPYCRIEVLPRFFFSLSQFPPQTTATRKKNLNPVWEQRLQLSVSEESFYTNGSVLCLSVLDHDLLTYNDLAGQAYLQLSRIPRAKSISTKRPIPTMTLPLRLPVPHQFEGPFQVLIERSLKEPTAKQLCDYERYIRDYRMLPPCADDVKETVVNRRQRVKKLFKAAFFGVS